MGVLKSATATPLAATTAAARRRIALLWSLVGAFVLAAGAVALHLQDDLYANEVAKARRDTEVINAASVAHTIRVVSQADTVLRAVRGYYARTQSLVDTERFMDRLALDRTPFDNIYLIDHSGRIVISHDPGALGRSTAERDYFQFHRDHPEDELYIGAVQPGIVTGKHHFRITRRIFGNDGSFAGVILVTLRPTAFSQYYRELAGDEPILSSLVATHDHKLRARTQEPPPEAWDRPVETPLWEHLARADTGSFTSRSPVDGIERTFHYRRVDDLPLVIVTGFARDAILARIRPRTLQVWGVAGAAGAFVLALAAALTLVIRQRAQLDGLVTARTAALAEAKDAADAAVAARNALTASERELRRIIDRMQDIYYRTDLDGCVVRLSPWWERLLGYRVAEMLGQPLRNYYVDPAHREVFLAHLRASGGEVVGWETLLRHRDGHPVWVMTNAHYVHDESGAVIGVEGTSRDITDRKRIEAELQEANRKLAELAITDPLTGLANRRHFNELLASEWSRARRSGRPLAVLMIDIDFFKRYNDRYGHQAGDDCLTEVARLIERHARRAGDVAARYGGEEFVVVAPETGEAPALALAREICAATARLELPHEDSTYGRVTVSIGVATAIPVEGLCTEDLVSRADSALYLAKSNGRNRAECAPAGPTA